MKDSKQKRISNTPIYVVLLIASVAACGFSFFFESSNRCFTILSSVGCSGIVSVIVAWLLERSNNRIQQSNKEQLTTMLLSDFNLYVNAAFSNALDQCAKITDLDMEQSYDLQKIEHIMEKIDAESPCFQTLFNDLKLSVEKLSPLNLLSFNCNDDGQSLYSYVSTLQKSLNSLDYILEIVPDPWELQKIAVLGTIDIIDKIQGLLNIHTMYQIREDDKKCIYAIRNLQNQKED